MEDLKVKIVKMAEHYTELVDKLISEELERETSDKAALNIVAEGIKMVSYVLATLEKINRPNQINDLSGHERD